MSHPNMASLARLEAIGQELLTHNLKKEVKQALVDEQTAILKELGRPPIEPNLPEGASPEMVATATAVTGALTESLAAGDTAPGFSLDALTEAQQAAITEQYLTSKGLITAKPKAPQMVFIQRSEDFYGVEILPGWHYYVEQDLPIHMNPMGSEIQRALANGYTLEKYITDDKKLAVLRIPIPEFDRRMKAGWERDAIQRGEQIGATGDSDAFNEVQKTDRAVTLSLSG